MQLTASFLSAAPETLFQYPGNLMLQPRSYPVQRVRNIGGQQGPHQPMIAQLLACPALYAQHSAASESAPDGAVRLNDSTYAAWAESRATRVAGGLASPAQEMPQDIRPPGHHVAPASSEVIRLR